MNKRTVALTTEQYKEIIQTTKNGFTGCRPNERVALALMLEGIFNRDKQLDDRFGTGE